LVAFAGTTWYPEQADFAFCIPSISLVNYLHFRNPVKQITRIFPGGREYEREQKANMQAVPWPKKSTGT
jgi:hypothetical protein